MLFNVYNAYASARADSGRDHVVANSAMARHSRRKSRNRAACTESFPVVEVDIGRRSDRHEV